MGPEYNSLAVMSFVLLFGWLPVSVGKLKSFGGKWLASNRQPLPNKELVPWAARCDRAYSNLKDNFPPFAVVVILLGLTNQFENNTATACAIYVMGRIGHYVFYGLGNVPLRFLFFSTALLCNLYLFYKFFF